jgi:hypothetical protein
MAEVRTTSAEYSSEHFSDDDEIWLSELETRASDLENEISVWREARQRALADEAYSPDAVPGPTHTPFRRVAGDPDRQPRDGRGAAPAGREGPPVHSAARRAAAHSQYHAGGQAERTRALIDHGRRSAGRRPLTRGRKAAIGIAILAVGITVLAVMAFRSGASWPPSVAVVQSEITTACQNPDVASEPDQVNFACGKSTSQILWVFSLMTSGDNANFSDAKSGREGLEPIAPAQGGEVAWSLNLHQPYNPYNPIDSLEVAARAINNIIGGATVTGSNGKQTVQAGLESNPANCARYTGSAATITRAGYPAICSRPVTSASGQAALVADVYQEWYVGASSVVAQQAGVLYQNASNPGNPQVQSILKSLFGPSA